MYRRRWRLKSSPLLVRLQRTEEPFQARCGEKLLLGHIEVGIGDQVSLDDLGDLALCDASRRVV